MVQIKVAVREAHGPSLEDEATVIVLHLTGLGHAGQRMDPAWRGRWRTAAAKLGVALEPSDEALHPAAAAAMTTEALAAWASNRPRRPIRAGAMPDDYVLPDMPRQLALEASRLAIATVDLTERNLLTAAAADRMRAAARQLRMIAEEAARRQLEHPVADILRQAAVRLGVPWRWSTLYPGMTMIGEGRRRTLFDTSMPLDAPRMGASLATNKITAKRYLAAFGLPVLPDRVIRHAADALPAAQAIGYPVAVKPVDASGGHGVTLDIRAPDRIRAAFERAVAEGTAVMIEPYLPVPDFRAILVGNSLEAVLQRCPAHVTGNGRSSVAELLADHNAAVAEGRAAIPSANPVVVDADVELTLANAGLSLGSVPETGRMVAVRSIPMRSHGGYVRDLTDQVHPANAAMFRRLMDVVGVPLAAIDFRAEAVERPWHEQRFAILEYNVRPNLSSFAGHPLIDALVRHAAPDPDAARLPTVLVVDPLPADGPAELRRRMAQHRIAGAVFAPDGLQLGGMPIPDVPTLGEAHARMVQDPTLALGVHWLPPDRLVQFGLGVRTIDIAVLPADIGGSLDARAVDLVRRHARRTIPLPGGDAATRARVILDEIAPLAR